MIADQHRASAAPLLAADKAPQHGLRALAGQGDRQIHDARQGKSSTRFAEVAWFLFAAGMVIAGVAVGRPEGRTASPVRMQTG